MSTDLLINIKQDLNFGPGKLSKSCSLFTFHSPLVYHRNFLVVFAYLNLCTLSTQWQFPLMCGTVIKALESACSYLEDV